MLMVASASAQICTRTRDIEVDLAALQFIFELTLLKFNNFSRGRNRDLGAAPNAGSSAVCESSGCRCCVCRLLGSPADQQRAHCDHNTVVISTIVDTRRSRSKSPPPVEVLPIQFFTAQSPLVAVLRWLVLRCEHRIP